MRFPEMPHRALTLYILILGTNAAVMSTAHAEMETSSDVLPSTTAQSASPIISVGAIVTTTAATTPSSTYTTRTATVPSSYTAGPCTAELEVHTDDPGYYSQYCGFGAWTSTTTVAATAYCGSCTDGLRTFQRVAPCPMGEWFYRNHTTTTFTTPLTRAEWV
ncbi:hypothetical protein F4778DRAFT_762406, partial [Xylariomycetidae sp. FL2044]